MGVLNSPQEIGSVAEPIGVIGADDEEPLPRDRRGNVTAGARFKRSTFGENVLATLFAAGVRLVHATNRITYEPATDEKTFDKYAPFIAASWHGQSFMIPMLRPPSRPADVLVSRHAEADLIANMLVRLGCGVIRGSGAYDAARMYEKGAVAGFRGMKTSLDQGRTVGVTADFLRNARRKVSPGIIALARLSGRPIIPTVFASSRRYEMSSWDRITICLPFGRSACIFGDPITVPADADSELLEAKRVELEAALNAATDRAYAIVDRRRG